ncbi:cell division ATP-binding protein FtsE [Ruicaihuangia caeni]|uniref:Cell division ATP-binding protein FtsE n=1 Tax=Ruicaihuangia caeni TaxID=3042517 RepID=A0AAW6T6Z2_9MICO|nr:cell division ATP-binding protein FtsE [Klugiella sp. YN-L-19]MDI2097407.1 cell division ATP-binding protein FtsE [Klugiella sp. YN-L-19]
MIRFDEVTKVYKGNSRPALDSVTLEILKGEFVFLVGASGSGKSSFLRLVLREDRPSKGQLHVLGQSLNTISSRKVPYFRRNIGVVFQDFRLLPNKTVFDNVAFTLQVIGKSKGFVQQAVPDVLNLVGLAGKSGRFPHELSGGEQQRVAIARAIVNRPAVLLADEPTGNLDPATSAGIMTLLERINANGTTVVMATHDVAIVDRLQRRVIELIGGRVVRDEREGGYVTQAMPVVSRDQAGAVREAPSAPMPSASSSGAVSSPVSPLNVQSPASAPGPHNAESAQSAQSAQSAPPAWQAPAPPRPERFAPADAAASAPASTQPRDAQPAPPPATATPSTPPRPEHAPGDDVAAALARAARLEVDSPLHAGELAEPTAPWDDGLDDTVIRAPGAMERPERVDRVDRADRDRFDGSNGEGTR